MLEELAKNNDVWYKYALKICNNHDDANDLVQEMYLRFYRNKNREANKSYVYQVILSIFLNSKKKKGFIKEPINENTINIKDSEDDVFYFEKLDNQRDAFFDKVYSDFHKIDQIIIKWSMELGQTKFSKMSNISLNTVKKINNNFKKKLCEQKNQKGLVML
jgi:hypothetical protein